MTTLNVLTALAVTEAPDLCVAPISALCAARTVGGAVTGGLGGLGGAATGMAMSGIGAMFVSGAADATTAMLGALDGSTRVDLSAAWFRANTAVLAAVTLPVVLGLFVLQVTGAALRREPGGLVRALVGVAKALLGAGVALAATQAALVACDEIATAIAASAGTTVTEATRQFLSLTYLAGPQVGPVLQILLGLGVIVGSFLLWAVLLFRKAALLLVAVFAPVAFAGAAWDHTRGWVRRWVELVAALVFSKIVIVVVFVVGVSAFGSAGNGSQPGQSDAAALSDLLVGLLLLGIAAFAPWLSWRFVHFAGAEVSEAMHATVARSPIPAATRSAARTARTVAVSAATRPLVGAVGGAASGARGAGPARAPAPARPPGPPSDRPGPATVARAPRAATHAGPGGRGGERR